MARSASLVKITKLLGLCRNDCSGKVEVVRFIAPYGKIKLQHVAVIKDSLYCGIVF